MTPSDRSRAGAAGCPKCRSGHIDRCRRRGLRDFIRRMAGQYPFRCRQCGHKFYLRQRSVPFLLTRPP